MIIKKLDKKSYFSRAWFHYEVKNFTIDVIVYHTKGLAELDLRRLSNKTSLSLEKLKQCRR